MKIIIYRSKESNKIVSHSEWRGAITEEGVARFNSNPKWANKAEVVDLDNNEIALYFYLYKARKLADYLEDIKDIKETISDIESRLDDRLYDIEKRLNKEIEE